MKLAIVLALAGIAVWAAIPAGGQSSTSSSSCRYTVAKKRYAGVEVTTITRICKLPSGARPPLMAR